MTRIGMFALALMALLPSMAGPARSAEFPSRPVVITVPTGAGGAADSIARLLAPWLTDIWGKPVIVENRPGAGGNIGTQFVARSSPDGHALLIYTPNVNVNRYLYRDLGYDPDKDLTPITQLATSPLILVNSAKSPIKTTRELLDLARRQPGQLSWASAVVGSPNHLGGELFRQRAELDVVNIAYKGIQEGMLDIIGGRVDFGVGTSAASLPLIRGGQLRALGVTSPQRSELMPDIPTISEGGVPGFSIMAWDGLWGPANMPPELAKRIQQDVAASLAEPRLREQLAALGFTAVGSTPEQFREVIQSETAESLIRN
ncbi:tripartite tricarboxylate transporter substrate binding protein (plasmid) [Roseomonas sp. OT10]|uniref:Bug family tripartite tricarboxylate transporter substrate binding protein n=1 Tax=Roseomonas cutis TaxID=2897332 RepID=UPI001E399486|nr:tripartite tricarboxylate transporter substrate binding protein [Roseomonas sp. OT10]UFN51541.1 tripartite tricarboxylate transporter substrate binding protein [Roseomonas sp. OT10]